MAGEWGARPGPSSGDRHTVLPCGERTPRGPGVAQPAGVAGCPCWWAPGPAEHGSHPRHLAEMQLRWPIPGSLILGLGGARVEACSSSPSSGPWHPWAS